MRDMRAQRHIAALFAFTGGAQPISGRCSRRRGRLPRRMPLDAPSSSPASARPAVAQASKADARRAHLSGAHHDIDIDKTLPNANEGDIPLEARTYRVIFMCPEDDGITFTSGAPACPALRPTHFSPLAVAFLAARRYDDADGTANNRPAGYISPAHADCRRRRRSITHITAVKMATPHRRRVRFVLKSPGLMGAGRCCRPHLFRTYALKTRPERHQASSRRRAPMHTLLRLTPLRCRRQMDFTRAALT